MSSLTGNCKHSLWEWRFESRFGPFHVNAFCLVVWLWVYVVYLVVMEDSWMGLSITRLDLTVVLAYNKRTTVSCPAIFIWFNLNTFKWKYTYHRLGTWGKPLVAFSISNLPHPRNQAMHSYLPHLDHPNNGLVHIQIPTALLSLVWSEFDLLLHPWNKVGWVESLRKRPRIFHEEILQS